jgi:DNA polymerase III delta subunit
MNPLEQVLASVDRGEIPSIVLVGGSSDYLVQHHFQKIRDHIVSAQPQVELETYAAGADLARIADSFRTHSLFGGTRLLVVSDVQAFVSRKELDKHLHKAIADWEIARTDRKRSGAIAKLMHVLGLAGLSTEQSDAEIVSALGSRKNEVVTEMLQTARTQGKSETRGEADAALLAEIVQQGGAPGSILLMKAGELPEESVVVDRIGQRGGLVRCDLTRPQFPEALAQAISEIAGEYSVKFQRGAVSALEEQLGATRILADKYSTELPDLSLITSEALRLAAFVGEGGTVTAETVTSQVTARSGGQRFEFASLFSEGKILEALEKLRDLVAQGRREEPRATTDILYGRYLFSLAQELRMLIAVHSFLRQKGTRAAAMSYNQFKGSLGDEIGIYLKEQGLARQKLHPFVVFRKYEAAGRYREKLLVRALQRVGEIELERKSGGVSAEIGLESLLMSMSAHGTRTTRY